MNVPKWQVIDDRPWFKSGLWQEGVPKHPVFPVISLVDWFDQKTEEFGFILLKMEDMERYYLDIQSIEIWRFK